MYDKTTNLLPDSLVFTEVPTMDARTFGKRTNTFKPLQNEKSEGAKLRRNVPPCTGTPGANQIA